MRYQQIKNIPLQDREIKQINSSEIEDDNIITSLKNKINQYNLIQDLIARKSE